uniref:Lin-28 homolog A (C. elegans) n=1 Tax=Cyprinus carpio TaxID=7962 RepID=A0A8C1SX46_CYPCA
SRGLCKDRGGGSRDGVCKWFNVRMGFGFLSMTHREGICLDSPVDVFVHQVRESKCMLSVLTERSRVRPSSVPVLLSRLEKGGGGRRGVFGGRGLLAELIHKNLCSKRGGCFNCGGPNHHAKECQLPPQPKKCHFCQSITHMVANCPIKAQQLSPGSQGKSTASTTGEEEDMSHTPFPPDSSD